MDAKRAYSEITSLKSNHTFMQGVESMKTTLHAQAMLFARDTNMSNKKRLSAMERCVVMQSLVDDMVEMLDGIILEAENQQFLDEQS